MSFPLAPQLVALLNLGLTPAVEASMEAFSVNVHCDLPGVGEEDARQSIHGEVDASEGMGVQADLVCGGPDEVVIHLSRQTQTATATIDLSVFPESTRPRALALGVAEAIPLLNTEDEAPQDEPPPSQNDRAQTSQTQRAPPIANPPTDAGIADGAPLPRTLPKVQILIGPTYRAYFQGDNQAGGKVSMAVDGFEMGVHALAGKKDGGARGSHMGGQIGYDFLYQPYRRARPALGVETNLGYSDSGNSSSGYGAALTFLGWNAPIAREWRTTIRGEFGYSFRGQSRAETRFAGGFYGMSVILGAAPEHREPFHYR